MPLSKKQKENIVEKLKEKVVRQKAMVFVSIEGLKAKELSELRKKLKQEDCSIQIAKKTLVDIVFKQRKFDFAFKKTEGQPALIFSFSDEISPAKITYQFVAANQKLKILGGFFNQQFRGAEEIVTLANIPSKQELLTKVVWGIKAPISSFVNVLETNIKGLINVLAKAKT
ncbi:MAG: 50S ribosomal protein L10 [Candidatus Nealsonbacteria bacterium]|nr:50S ribosomal protein L10 [Candidatus Nealsonbacteria bacterium]